MQLFKSIPCFFAWTDPSDASPCRLQLCTSTTRQPREIQWLPDDLSGFQDNFFSLRFFWIETCAALCRSRNLQTLEENLPNQACSAHGLYACSMGILVNAFTSKRVLTAIHENWRLCQCSYPAPLQPALLMRASGSLTWRDTFWGSNVYYQLLAPCGSEFTNARDQVHF